MSNLYEQMKGRPMVADFWLETLPATDQAEAYVWRQRSFDGGRTWWETPRLQYRAHCVERPGVFRYWHGPGAIILPPPVPEEDKS